MSFTSRQKCAIWWMNTWIRGAGPSKLTKKLPKIWNMTTSPSSIGFSSSNATLWSKSGDTSPQHSSGVSLKANISTAATVMNSKHLCRGEWPNLFHLRSLTWKQETSHHQWRVGFKSRHLRISHQNLRNHLHRRVRIRESAPTNLAASQMHQSTPNQHSCTKTLSSQQNKPKRKSMARWISPRLTELARTKTSLVQLLACKPIDLTMKNLKRPL